MDQYNLVMVGLGGQGVMTISQILATTASKEGIPVRLFEATGLTQRGGSVQGHLRLGESYSPKIPLGNAQGLICLELSEIARGSTHYLAKNGKVWINTAKIYDHHTKLRPDLYPSIEKLKALVNLRTDRIYMIPADSLAQDAGSAQAVNMVMIGAFANYEPILKTDSIVQAIHEKSGRFAPINIDAFWKGYNFIKRQ